MFRSALYRVGEEEHLLFLSMHHIVSDQWSFGVMSTELSTIYAARCAGEPDPLPPLPLQHVDYVAWHRRWLETDAHQRQLEYWKEQLAGLPVLDMPSDRVRPAMQSMRGASVIVPLSAELAAMTAQLSRHHNASPFMVFLAAFLTLLHRYSGASDLAVGSPIANRNWLESEHLISSFVNTLVLRVDVAGDPTFSEVVDRVQSTTLDAYAHQDLPFDRLVEELRPPRDLSRSPLFQVFFNLQNAPMSLPHSPASPSRPYRSTGGQHSSTCPCPSTRRGRTASSSSMRRICSRRGRWSGWRIISWCCWSRRWPTRSKRSVRCRC